jgi:16S rRNA processing protein RimM
VKAATEAILMLTRMHAEANWTLLARLVRPQGRHGEILSDILTDFPERFAERKRLFLIGQSAGAPAREVTLERHWLHKGRVVLKLSGVDSINDAEALRGLTVAIPATERAELTDDSVYISDLVGCRVVDLSEPPRTVGEITDVDRDAALLVVRPETSGRPEASGGRAEKEELLIPFAKAYLVNVDLENRRVEMRLPAGLLEINAPLSDEERQALDTSGEDERS